jgi:hypothetical protein
MQTILNFEDLGDLVFVIDDYASRGVVIPDGAAIHSHPAVAHSGVQYLSPYRREFATTAYFRAQFQPIRPKRVSLYAGTEGGEGAIIFGVLRAFAVNGTQVAVHGPLPIKVGVCSTRFEVVAPSNQIAWIIVEMFGFDPQGLAFDPDQAIDDLEFDFAPKPPIRHVPIRPPNYDPFWWLKTHFGLTPPEPYPWENWLRPFAAALDLANVAQNVSEQVRPDTIKVAKKQASIAVTAIKMQAERGKNQENLEK